MKDLQMTAPEELQYAAEYDKIDLSDYMPRVQKIFREQIIKAWNNGSYGGGQFTTTHDTAEQYYEDTYGK